MWSLPRREFQDNPTIPAAKMDLFEIEELQAYPDYILDCCHSGPSRVVVTEKEVVIGKQRQPFVFYVHPWEVDPQQPRISGPSRVSQFRHRVNLRSTQQKLNRLLERFRFDSLQQVIANTVDNDGN